MILILKKGAGKKEMDEIHEKLQLNKRVNTKKYGGTIKLKDDPLTIQKRMRKECNEI
jgi:hypothetical protein